MKVEAIPSNHGSRLSFLNNLEILLITILFVWFWGRLEHIFHQVLQVFQLSNKHMFFLNIGLIILLGGILMFMLDDVIDLLNVADKRQPNT